MFEAGKQNGDDASICAVPKHRTDREIVPETVKPRWRAIRYAALEQKADREKRLEATSQIPPPRCGRDAMDEPGG